MPIRPDLRTFYRGPWLQVRLRILARAHHRCEQCGVPNHQRVERGPDGLWRSLLSLHGKWHDHHGQLQRCAPFGLSGGLRSATRQVHIVLTVAHLNHTPGDDRDENLKALCQWCHLHYDQSHHAETRATRKDAARPLLDAVRKFSASFEAAAQSEAS